MKLPKRWKKLLYHPEQARLWSENKRFKVVPSGRRSGKTELAKRRLVLSLKLKKPWEDARYFAAAPTKEQAKRIYWNDLKALIPPSWILKISESNLCITTVYGSELWVVGLDKPERIEGVPWDGGVLDEYANMKSTAWSENIRPALSDRGGWCWLIGVPEGHNHYKDLADYAKSGRDPDWGYYSWPSKDILESSEIAAAKRALDPKTFSQEYEASFEGSTNRVYYAYDSELHDDPSIELAPTRQLNVCMDFNVDPCVWVILQTDGVVVRVFDEIALRNTNTVEMGQELIRRYGGHRGGIVIYGDAAGSARSTTGKSDYALLLEMGFQDQRIKSANPHVKDRVNAVNAMLLSTKGEVRLEIHPRCVYLRRDFETVTWSKSGNINKSDFLRTHATDALGYFITQQFPLRAARLNPHRRFYK